MSKLKRLCCNKKLKESEIYELILKKLEAEKKVSEEISILILNKLEFYICSANKGKIYYLGLNLIIIILGLIISFLSSLGSSPQDRIITGLSLLVTGISSVITFMDYKTRWQRYRVIAENMEKEIRKFSIEKEMKEKTFIRNIEKVISDDVQHFHKSVKNKKNVKPNN